MNLFSISFLVILVFDIIKSNFVLEIFQQNLYNENHKYFKWILTHKRIVVLSLDFFSLLCFFMALILDNNISKILVILSYLFYLLETFRILSFKKNDIVNGKLIVSKKIKRMIFTLSSFYIIPFILYLVNYEYGYLSLLMEGLFIYFIYLIIWIVKIINTPLEYIIDRYYFKIAKEKMNKMKNLIVVGITGTYGKSSTKDIADTVLKNFASCQSTPKNLNTLRGLVATINNYLDESEEIFVVEMGSYKSGEVHALCDLVKPQYAIITNIEDNQLTMFRSVDESIHAKFELVESLDENGVAVLNFDDPWQVKYSTDCKCKKLWISLDNEADYMASDIKYSSEGTRFIVQEKGTNQKYTIRTKLLGKHNVYHILSVLAVAREMGMSVEEVQNSILKLRPLENHLELRNVLYMHQINNTHRSNPQGAKNALDVLALMPGTKIVVTTGMQTFGEKNQEFNNIFGTQVAKIANYVILIGMENTKSVFRGLMESGFDSKKVYIVNRAQDAYTLLQEINSKKEIYALFESDEDLKI